MKRKPPAVDLARFISEFYFLFPELNSPTPWQALASFNEVVSGRLTALPSGYRVKGDVAIHKTATLEEHVTLKGPVIISPRSFIAAHCYLRAGVFLGPEASLGPGCEVKSSLIFPRSVLAHFNYVGNSIVGSGVNMEAGAVIANHYNERVNKQIYVRIGKETIATGLEKFGAIVGDQARIGANAVLSPGTVLPAGSIVKRLELVEQVVKRAPGEPLSTRR